MTDFYSGATVRYDRHGTGHVAAVAPEYTEGTALDPLGRIITTTRFSHYLMRLDPATCIQSVIDPQLPNNEGPTFDFEGNLYVGDNRHNRVVEYTWPQYPGQKPVLIYDFEKETGQGTFLEDLKIAPEGSPYKGDLFVQYSAGARFGAFQAALGVGGTDQIARFTRTENGWERQADFYDMRVVHARFESLGMAFHPDGSLLVNDFTGTGNIIRISPDGKFHTVFATIPPRPGEHLVKIDVTQPDGYVYVTGVAGSCTGQAAAESSTRLIRLDPNGGRMVPDFTDISEDRCFVGVSVPHHFTPDLDIPFIPPPVLPPIAAIAAPPPPPPPPPIPVLAPAPAPAPA
ncbi:MAG: hypothetical protein ACRD1T_24030, partial [Acidimicrobiia bacterium]